MYILIFEQLNIDEKRVNSGKLILSNCKYGCALIL